MLTYQEIIERRWALRIGNYATLADADFEGPWVTPYQIPSCSFSGPVLVAYHWFDVSSMDRNREILWKLGYMPKILSNRVLDQALEIAGMDRSGIYVTQAFHLIPAKRSGKISAGDVDISFEAVTRHELIGRRVICLGNEPAAACRRHGIEHVAVRHPSARGVGLTVEAKAQALSRAIVGGRAIQTVGEYAHPT